MTKNNILVLVLTIICIVLLYLWLKKPEVVIPSEQPLLDSITALTKRNLAIDSMNRELKAQNDSIEKSKQRTIVLYREKLIFIDKATLQQLDSIIRKEAHL